MDYQARIQTSGDARIFVGVEDETVLIDIAGLDDYPGYGYLSVAEAEELQTKLGEAIDAVKAKQAGKVTS